MSNRTQTICDTPFKECMCPVTDSCHSLMLKLTTDNRLSPSVETSFISLHHNHPQGFEFKYELVLHLHVLLIRRSN